MVMLSEIQVCHDITDVAFHAASLVIDRCAEAIASRGRCSLALSGGSTPLTLFRLLRTPEWSARLDWSRVNIFWADERCVPESHPASNSGVARRAFLDTVPATLFPMYADGCPEAAAAAYEAVLRRELVWEQLEGFPCPLPRFDCILLGMGNDGHTASLFPQTSEWAAELTDKAPSSCVAVTTAPYVDPHLPEARRITLRLAVLNAANCCLFLVTGAAKYPVLSRLLDAQLADEYPAQSVRPAHGELRWIVDTACLGQQHPNTGERLQ